jgi:hypothetical protein
LDAADPVRIVAMMLMPMVGEDRVIAPVPVVPRPIVTGVVGAIEVAEVESKSADADERGVEEGIVADDKAGAIPPAGGLPERPMEVDRRIDQTAIFERVVPVSIVE